MRVCPDRLCSADVDASAFHVLLGLPTLRIAIHRRKGAALKFLFIVVSFFPGDGFTLFKNREVFLPAVVAARARALPVFVTSAHAERFRSWHVSDIPAATRYVCLPRKTRSDGGR